MTAVTCEALGSRRLEVRDGQRVVKQRWHVKNAADSSAAESALLAAVPYSVGSLKRTSYSLEEQRTKHPDAFYVAEVEWTSSNVPVQAGEMRIRVQGGTATQKRMFDIQTIEVQGDITSADLKGAINVVDGQPEGVDEIVPSTLLVIERGLAAGTITFAYIEALVNLQGHVNNAIWNSFAIGTAKFLSFDTTQSSNDVDRISYTFGLEQNVTSLVVGDYTFASKDGWDYLSVGTVSVTDPINNVKIPKARWAAIHRTAPRSNFTTALGF